VESAKDVSLVIRAVQPDVTLLELDSSRVSILNFKSSQKTNRLLVKYSSVTKAATSLPENISAELDPEFMSDDEDAAAEARIPNDISTRIQAAVKEGSGANELFGIVLSHQMREVTHE
jgi:hypothetical protein